MKHKTWIMACALLCGWGMASCSSGNGSTNQEPEPPTPVVKKIPISLSCGISAATRATDTGFDSGDCIGLYVVNYNGSTPGTLQSNGNHVNNMRFTYSGVWTPDQTIYWKDDTTPADFYCYYPYTASVADVAALPFSVKEDQSALSSYKASDFLWGKSAQVKPTEQAVMIQTKHLFSCVVVKVAAGNGFTSESLAAAQVSVKLNGLKTTSTINLRDGAVTASGEAKSILPLKEEGNYKALLIPQTASASNLVTVTIDGRDYNLNKEVTFGSGKRCTITVTVSKTSNGINVGIDGWEDEEIDNGGTAE